MIYTAITAEVYAGKIRLKHIHTSAASQKNAEIKIMSHLNSKHDFDDLMKIYLCRSTLETIESAHNIDRDMSAADFVAWATYSTKGHTHDGEYCPAAWEEIYSAKRDRSLTGF